MQVTTTSYDSATFETAMQRAKAERSQAISGLLKVAFRALFGDRDAGDHPMHGTGQASLAR